MAVVMDELAGHVEPDSVPSDQAPVRRCLRYIANRPGQFDYAQVTNRALLEPPNRGLMEPERRARIC
jgi:hypothetical protein